MLVAIYARSANEDDVIIQVENCRRYILENWNLKTQIKLFAEIMEGPQNLENCLELQKLLKEDSDTLNQLWYTIIKEESC